MQKKTVQFSKKFCRDLIENNLPVLLFFHIRIAKYLNLVSKFVISCDNAGDYSRGKAVDRNQLFTVNPKEAQKLVECKKFRNHKSWFESCEGVCKKFQLTHYQSYFEPLSSRIDSYVEFLNKYISGLKQVSIVNIKEMMLESNGNKVSPRSLFIDEPEEENDENVIFKSGLNPVLKIENFQSLFGSSGICLREAGKNTLANLSLYNHIKASLSL